MVLRTDCGTWTFDTISKPAWAAAVGRDEFGLYADLEVKGVLQRMRWIAPGLFRMGSPEDEQGRSVEEGPARDVAIEHGYWLADTPCTQAMWTAVMGKNPSQFQKPPSPERPVERVSWDEAKKFAAAVHKALPAEDGLQFRLPWEDEWEHAARAGTTPGSYAGKVNILGRFHAPILDAIAWYGGNSEVDKAVKGAVDSSGWTEKQYPHHRVATQAVKGKLPNGFGLYETIGNVWEWCEDLYEAYPGGSAGLYLTLGRLRGLRGGGFASGAAYCRAAQRYARLPDFRWYDLGFRLARGPVRAPSK